LVPCKHLLGFIVIIFALEMILDKNYLSSWAEPEGSTHARIPAQQQARHSPSGPSGARTAREGRGLHGRRRCHPGVRAKQAGPRLFKAGMCLLTRALARRSRPCPVPTPTDRRPPSSAAGARTAAAPIRRSRCLPEQAAESRSCTTSSRVRGHLPVVNQSPERRRHLAPQSAAAKVRRRPPCRPSLPVVSISPATPRSPLPIPHLGRARGRSNRRHCRWPAVSVRRPWQAEGRR
jgi:hypothetical protein